jgi:hypothetical protein
MTKAAFFVLAAALMAPAAAFAAKSKPPQSIDGTTLLSELKSSGVDKKRFEAYVKRRVSKIMDHHKARMDFLAKESDIWTSFWTKVRDERKLFEIRIARQMLDVFESVSQLDVNDQAASLSDFERLQSNVIKSFETQQRQKLTEFFGARDQRWKEFVGQQERERSDFLAESPTDWQATKGTEAAPATARKGRAAKPVKASRATVDSQDGEDEAEAGQGNP